MEHLDDAPLNATLQVVGCFSYSQMLGGFMTKKEIVLLFKYDAWATDHQLTVIKNLSDAQYEKDMGSSHKGIQGTLTHMYGAERVWLSRWTGKGENAMPEGLLPHGAIRDRYASLQSEIQEYAESLTDEKLFASFPYRDLRGNPYSQPLWQQMQHVANHSTYHRGQITTMLRQLGVTPVPTDLIAYYRQH
jgi:uncharacterized damage-inducible protein DinB